jgi:hypothetical protein
MSDRYSIGKQPCQDLKRAPGGIMAAPEMPNVHECYRCGGNVSFCETCARDHHEDGYETCEPKTSRGEKLSDLRKAARLFGGFEPPEIIEAESQGK